MGFNYAREKRKFDEKWKKLEEWYRKSGMSEDAIREMHKYDWSEFNSTRKFYRRGEDNIDVESIAEEDVDAIDKTFFGRMDRTSRHVRPRSESQETACGLHRDR